MAKKKTKDKIEFNEPKNERGRNHMLLLYPEDATHVKAMERIKESYDYAAILHNKDVDENGEVKKEHWHVVLQFKNATWMSSIAKELGIELNYIRKVGNVNNALEYLIHYNEPEKYKYDISEVFGPKRVKLAERIKQGEKTEGEKVIDLIDYISSFTRPITIKEFAIHCANEGYWSEFRRSSSIIMSIINEHNSQFYTKEKS